MNQFFGEILTVAPDTITFLAVAACVVIFFGSLFWEKMRDIAPGLMISAGIIGTFWGTFIALSGFQTGVDASGVIDYKTIVAKIPVVLGGMTSAFITSLIGLFAAFCSRILFFYLPKSKPQLLPIEETTVDLLNKIREAIAGESDNSMLSQLSALRTEYRDGTKDLKQSISGTNDDSSLVAQFMKLRNENNDGFNKLDDRLGKIMDTLTERMMANLDTLMKQIHDVILNQFTEQLKQTNELLSTQLSEMLGKIEDALIKQFGQTFKQFNEATQAIKKWQEDHKLQVEQLTQAFEQTAKGIEKIRADCESIPATMGQLKNLMGELDQRLQAFADMKEKAEQSFPMIKKHLDSIGKNLQESAAGFNGLEATIENMKNEIQQSSRKQQEEIRKTINVIMEQLKQVSAEFNNQIRETMDDIANKWGENMVAIAEAAGEKAKSSPGNR